MKALTLILIGISAAALVPRVFAGSLPGFSEPSELDNRLNDVRYSALARLERGSVTQRSPRDVGEAQVTWGTPDLMNGIGDASGTPLPFGDLVETGSFQGLTNAQITANENNFAFLNSHFVDFSNGAIGDNTSGFGSAGHGYWIDDSSNFSSTLGIANAQIYYWVFNATTTGAATQYGIFTAPNNARWTFPDDGQGTPPTPTVTDLSDVPHDSTGILVGGFGNGISGDGSSPLYNLAVITPVPEPSTFVLLSLGLTGAGAICRRKKS